MMLRLRLQQAAHLRSLFSTYQFNAVHVAASGSGRSGCTELAAHTCHGRHRTHSTALLAMFPFLSGASFLFVGSQTGNCDANSQGTQESETTPGGVSNEHTAKFSIFCDKARRYAAEEKYLVAEQWWEKAQREAIAGFGEGDGHLAVTANGLADVYRCQGGDKFQLADALYRKSLEITAACYGKGDVRYAQALQNLGQYCSDAGQHAEALRHLNEAYSVKQSSFGKQHIDCARTIALIGDVHLHAEQTDKAIAAYERSLHMLQELGQDQGSVAAAIQKKLVTACLARGKLDAALQAVEKMLPYARNVHITEHSTAMHCLESVVDALAGRGESYKAIEAATTLYQARKGALPPGDPNTALAENVLARTLLQSKVTGHAGQALVHMLQSAEVLRRTSEKMQADCNSSNSWWSWLQGTSTNSVFSALRANAAAVELARVACLCLQSRVLKIANDSQKDEIQKCVATALALLRAPVDVAERQQAPDGVHVPSRLLHKAERSRQEALQALQKSLEEHPDLRFSGASKG